MPTYLVTPPPSHFPASPPSQEREPNRSIKRAFTALSTTRLALLPRSLSTSSYSLSTPYPSSPLSPLSTLRFSPSLPSSCLNTSPPSPSLSGPASSPLPLFSTLSPPSPLYSSLLISISKDTLRELLAPALLAPLTRITELPALNSYSTRLTPPQRFPTPSIPPAPALCASST